MIVEVCGVNFRNLGAALMLAAASAELRQWPEVTGICVNAFVATPRQRRSVRCHAVVRVDAHRLRRLRRPVQALAALAPTPVLGAAGMIKESATDVLLDASGFLFGDQHGAAPAERRGLLYESYRRRRKPVVLLPQSFGPFEVGDVARASRATLEVADLIFARDQASLAHLGSLGLVRPVIRMAPDFTNLLEPTPRHSEWPMVVVIPNARMTSMVDRPTGRAYLEFLERCTDFAITRGFQALVLVHDAGDHRIAGRLVARTGGAAALVKVRDPLQAKAIIGGSSMVISSRYHGLISAMSQAVPAMGTSWSHKYEQLFADYDCPDALWDPREAAFASERLGDWLGIDALEGRRARLRAPALRLKSEARAMWAEVKETITS